MAKTMRADAVAEWRALQGATPPVLLADHLTWLRIQGETQEPRLLATVADRAPAGKLSRTRLPPISAVGTEYLVGGGGVGGEELGDNAPGTAGTEAPLAEPDVTAPNRGGGAAIPLVPLEPFLQLAKERRNSDNTADGLRRRPEGNTQTAEVKREGSQLTNDVNTVLKEHGADDAYRSQDRCGFLHLVVDGVVFQVQAARPSGITRVWEKVLPAVS